ncbi:Cytochrome P450 [Trinorchestia longiramus]|nr:Cytochrome P450 [Trinorchestia longiramus]
MLASATMVNLKSMPVCKLVFDEDDMNFDSGLNNKSMDYDMPMEICSNTFAPSRKLVRQHLSSRVLSPRKPVRPVAPRQDSCRSYKGYTASPTNSVSPPEKKVRSLRLFDSPNTPKTLIQKSTHSSSTPAESRRVKSTSISRPSTRSKLFGSSRVRSSLGSLSVHNDEGLSDDSSDKDSSINSGSGRLGKERRMGANVNPFTPTNILLSSRKRARRSKKLCTSRSIFKSLILHLGVVGSNGAHWQHDRRFVLRNLRNLGMGKSYLEEAINIEAKALVEDLKKYNDEAINFPDSFRTVALNIIWQMVASTRYDLRSNEVEAIYRLTNEFQKNFSFLSFLPMFIPSLNKLPKGIKDVVFKENLFDEFLAAMRSVVEKTVDKHLENYDPENPRDLIDEYIKGMKESEGDEDSFFRKGALYQIITDLFGAGSDTINNMLKWDAFLLARYPEYSKRMQEQIDEVVARDHMVSLDDKPRLPLVEAFTVEALRYSSMIILNVQRMATRDTTIQGYFVPKDTIVQVANYCIHHDPQYWDDPHKFYPERFLDESGTKFTAPKQGFFAFGSGRRQCAGELLARMELFLFTAAIIQNFNVRAEEGVDLAKQEFSNNGGLRLPMDQKFIYEARK